MAFGELDDLKAAPTGRYPCRIRFAFKGIEGTSLAGEPEYEFELHSMGLFEKERRNLAKHLDGVARKDFWEVYSLFRNAETIAVRRR